MLIRIHHYPVFVCRSTAQLLEGIVLLGVCVVTSFLLTGCIAAQLECDLTMFRLNAHLLLEVVSLVSLQVDLDGLLSLPGLAHEALDVLLLLLLEHVLLPVPELLAFVLFQNLPALDLLLDQLHSLLDLNLLLEKHGILLNLEWLAVSWLGLDSIMLS